MLLIQRAQWPVIRCCRQCWQYYAGTANNAGYSWRLSLLKLTPQCLELITNAMTFTLTMRLSQLRLRTHMHAALSGSWCNRLFHGLPSPPITIVSRVSVTSFHSGVMTDSVYHTCIYAEYTIDRGPEWVGFNRVTETYTNNKIHHKWTECRLHF